jgi:hypothetical protein
MVRRPSGRRRVHSIGARFRQIERIDKHVNHPNRVALVNEIIEGIRAAASIAHDPPLQ